MRFLIRLTKVAIALTILIGAVSPARGDFKDTVSIEHTGAGYHAVRNSNPHRDSFDFFVKTTVSGGDADRWQSAMRQTIATDVGIAAPRFDILHALTGTRSLLRVEADEALRSLEVGVDQAAIALRRSSAGDAYVGFVNAPAMKHVGGVVPEPAILVLMLVGLPIVIARPRRARAG